jgi:hypothetical protein
MAGISLSTVRRFDGTPVITASDGDAIMAASTSPVKTVIFPAD